MRVGHSKSGLRIHLEQEEFEALVPNPDHPKVWVSLNPKSQTAFLQMASFEFPGAILKGLSKGYGPHTYPDVLTLQDQRFTKARAGLPNFSPEAVAVKNGTNTHNGVIHEVVRPPMKAAPNMGRNPLPRGMGQRALAKQAKLAALQASTAPSVRQLPKVAKGPGHETISEASEIMTLKAAICVINDTKEQRGDALMLSITKTGKLRVLVEYGDHEDDDPADAAAPQT